MDKFGHAGKFYSEKGLFTIDRKINKNLRF